MKIIIQDHDGHQVWHDILVALAAAAGVECVELPSSTPDLSFIRQVHNSQDNIVFLHTPNWPNWNEAQKAEDNPLQCVVVHIGSAGFAGIPSEFNNRRFSVPVTARQFQESGQGARFFQSISNKTPDWSFLRPSFVIPQSLAAWALWKEAEILGMTLGRTRPHNLPNDGDELLKTEFKTFAMEAESSTREWDGRDLEPVRKLLQVAAGNA